MAPPTLETLPYDIKHEIYKYALCKPGPMFVHSGRRLGLGAGILRVNKAVYHDAINVLYHYNHFWISSGWLEEIGHTNLANIRSLRFTFRMQFLHPPFLSIIEMAKAQYTVSEDTKAVCRDLHTLARCAPKLRNLEIVAWPMLARSPDTFINHIAILKVIAAIQQVTSLTLDGEIPAVWPVYLNRVLRKPVTYTSLPLPWGLQYAKRECEEEMEDLDMILMNLGADDMDDPYRDTDNGLRAVLQAAEWDWQEPSFLPDVDPLDDESIDDEASDDECIEEYLNDEHLNDEHLNDALVGDALLYDEPLDNESQGESPLVHPLGGVFDEPEKYDLGSTARLFTGDSGLDLIKDTLELHSGKYWSPLVFYRRSLQIQEQKMRVLVGFWNEIRTMGILERKKVKVVTARDRACISVTGLCEKTAQKEDTVSRPPKRNFGVFGLL